MAKPPGSLRCLLLSGDSALRTFARASVGLSTLATHWKMVAMAETLVAVDLNLAANVGFDLSTEIALDLVVAFKVITQSD